MSAAITLAVLLIALLVNRFAPGKRAQVRRAMAVLVLFLLALGASLALARLGYEGWARTLSSIARLLAIFNVIAAVRLLIFDLVLSSLEVGPSDIVVELLMGAAYLTATFIVIRDSGLELSGIITTSAVVTGILALSLQATLTNAIGGVVLQADESVEIGDWVELENGKRGIVTKIGWRYTVLETNDWDALIVPNATLLASTFTILGRRGGERANHRMWVHFNVDFRFNPSDVIEVVERAIRSAPIEGVLSEPPPNCVCMNFAESGRDSMAYYAVRYWLTDLRIDDPTNSRVRTRIYAALRRAEIPLAVPAQHLWVENDSEARRERKRRRAQDRRLGAITALPFLAPLDEDELDYLADHLGHVPFAAGEIVTRQDAVAHFLYIIVEGTVELRVYSGDAYDVVRTVTGPGFVGEMGLMTGAPRMATVVATTDLECYRLDKDAFQHVIGKRPDLAREISELLAQRAIELSEAKEGIGHDKRSRHVEDEKKRLLANIRSFFALDGR